MQRLSFVGRSLSLALLYFAAALNLVGCSRKIPEIPQASVDHLETIYQAFDKASEALGRGPKDMEEFKKFLPAGQSVDDVLTSPRDGKPYKLVWNVNPRVPPITTSPPLIAYEQEGKDGVFDAITTMGVIRCNGDELKKYIADTPDAGQ